MRMYIYQNCEVYISADVHISELHTCVTYLQIGQWRVVRRDTDGTVV